MLEERGMHRFGCPCDPRPRPAAAVDLRGYAIQTEQALPEAEIASAETRGSNQRAGKSRPNFSSQSAARHSQRARPRRATSHKPPLPRTELCLPLLPLILSILPPRLQLTHCRSHTPSTFHHINPHRIPSPQPLSDHTTAFSPLEHHTQTAKMCPAPDESNGTNGTNGVANGTNGNHEGYR